MIVGCAKEIKTHEYRVGLTPQNVKEYIEAGHQVLIERGAGEAIGFLDSHYEKYGAKLVNKDELFEKSQMIVKVKEPLQSEYEYFRENQILYTYLHLAADENLTQMLLKKHISSIAYETIKVGNALPCLAPMSAIAGRLAIFEAAKYSQKTYGGSGILLSGIAGVKKGKVVIIGGGVVGINAAQIALGIGADVSILDIDTQRLAYIDQIFNMKVHTYYSSKTNLLSLLEDADVVIGAILIPGAKAPKIVNKNDLSIMKKSSILVDVAIDQGGCFETSKPTTHSDPIYVFDDIVHYCVANMPGCVAKTSTLALTDVTLKFGLQIANNGFKEAVLKNEVLLSGLNTYKGMCTYEAVAKAFNIDYIDAKKALA
ncbi:alanine dehydrogenase [Campylobacter hepaticus]|uniref:Alanine dehydrogenase n=1 Tax=Campylobacter hepaticus TaxID=1813019 RepID=A0A424Z1A0_9BACT|nr:alanine dehydrogenase [Campylobacter hepaticus]RQD68963.1 alanine dehydrogenase [Campylobacter hepaticus]RQD87922.1 alanine dehydrogenase [Campylobacter hepaticus]